MANKTSGKVTFTPANQQTPVAIHVDDVNQWVNDLPADEDGCKVVPKNVTSIRDPKDDGTGEPWWKKFG